MVSDTVYLLTVVGFTLVIVGMAIYIRWLKQALRAWMELER